MKNAHDFFACVSPMRMVSFPRTTGKPPVAPRQCPCIAFDRRATTAEYAFVIDIHCLNAADFYRRQSMSKTKLKTASRPRGRLLVKSGRSRAEEAYTRLYDEILNGKLEPGSRLLETELAEWVGISRTPVREALKRLESEGLVVAEPNLGLVVASFDSRMINELYAVREVLEGTAAAFAARHASDSEVAVLREIANRDKEIGDDVALIYENNKQFHSTLYSSAHNQFLLKTLRILRGSMALLGKTTLSQPERQKSSIEQHERIVSAIERRAPEEAEQAARAHIRDAHRLRLRLLHKIGIG
jgi:DNA-binding GntR family transcriptional regulator